MVCEQLDFEVEFLEGVQAVERFRCEGVPIQHLYEPETGEYEAFYAGIEAGHLQWCRDMKRVAASCRSLGEAVLGGNYEDRIFVSVNC